MNTIIFAGSVLCYRLYPNGCYQNIKLFPEAKDKHGNPDTNHASVLKYIKEHT